VERIDFDLEEYRALRSEIIQSMDDGNQIMTFGLAAVGLVLGAGLIHKDTLLGFLVLGFFLPVLAALVLSMWFAAQERIARASHYLTGVEVRIKSTFLGERSVSWEAWLRAPKPGRRSEHFWSTEQAGIGLFGVIIVSSIVMGLAAGGTRVGATLKAFVTAASILISALMMLHIRRRFINWKRWLSTFYDPPTWEASSEEHAEREKSTRPATRSGL
jgi:hypothetical protein